jgi:hypothetical protein
MDYAINYDYISKVLCINKDKPELKCNGKCHLMKELAKLQKMTNPFLIKAKFKSLADLFVTEASSF